MSPRKINNPDEVWKEWFATDAFQVDKSLRRMFRLLPRDPRCKFCNVPFDGIGGAIAKAVFRKEQSTLNPRFCNLCDEASRQYPGGNEVEMAMLFADIRGSTALSELMSPTEFSNLINRFYILSTKLIIDEDGLVEKLAGDEVAAFWGSGFAGPDFTARTVRAAENLAKLMAKHEIPVGIGVHAGVAFFGVMGTPDGLTNITAIGDEVNTAARLASKASAGEIIISEAALEKAGIDASGFEKRTLELKGISAPMAVRVIGVK